MSALKGDVTGDNSIAVTGTATGKNSIGVSGKGDTNGLQTEGGANGVYATGKGWCGVIGLSQSTSGGFGVYGENTAGGTGVAGISKKWVGVYGETAGVENGPAGVWGEHKGAGIGVKAISNTGVGLVAFSHGTAAIFQGDVQVTGDIRLTNADCAEEFDIYETVQIEPGTVMVLAGDGKLEESQKAYDKRVAGVVSGAGNYKPGIVLDKHPSGNTRQPIALLGKVFCKVDALYGAIEVGDLLTTSLTPGHAMKADDPLKAFGSVIGKALCPLGEGRGLIPILIALQ